jgi:hypothetical protein
MRPALLALLLAPLLALTAITAASEEAVGLHVRVLFDDPSLAGYAAEVAATADGALLELAELFGVTPPQVVLTLDPDTDVFNAFAPLLPRPGVALRPLFPLAGQVGYSARDPLRLLLLHELTHTVQLGYRELPEGVAPLPAIGLVGERVAPPPPLWFIEGLATWVESTRTPGGGRLQDARTLGLLDSLALEGDWPALDGAGLATYGAWPGGQTRYLVGSGFVGHLIDRHGFPTLLAALRAFNGGGPFRDFSAAWREATGEGLDEAWEAYRQTILARAGGRATTAGERLGDSGPATGTPTLSPDGRRLAWTVWPPAVAVAELTAEGLGPERRYPLRSLPSSLAWRDTGSLVLTRIDRRPGSELSELFALDLEGGRERRLGEGSRAALVRVGPEGCLWFVRDLASEGSQLLRRCPDEGGELGAVATVWRAPAGTHLVGLALSDEGRVAMSLWRDGRVGLALLGPEGPIPLEIGAGHAVEPVWEGERTLLYAGDADGRYQLYAVAVDGGAPQQLTAELGGAFAPAGSGVFVALGGGGYHLARVSDPPLPASAELRPRAEALLDPDPGAIGVRARRPLLELAPYGWLPSDGALEVAPFRVALALDLLGQDDLGEHSYALTVGVDSALTGHLGGAHAALRYGWRDPAAFTPLASPPPLSLALRLGVWPHRPHLEPVRETALGGEAEATVRFVRDPLLQARLRVGVVHLQSVGAFAPELRGDLTLSRQFTDPFGYRSSGGRLTVSLRSTASEAGRSSGAWVDGSLFVPAPFGLPGTGELALRSGWRPTPPVPLRLDPLAAVATVGYRASVPLAWRLGDGRYALERLTIELRARSWFDGVVGVGGDAGVWADTLLWYAAPLSFGGSVGYSEGWWGRVGLRFGL